MNRKELYTLDEWMSEKSCEEIDLLTFYDMLNAAIDSAYRVCEIDFNRFTPLLDVQEHETGAHFCTNEIKTLIH